MELFASYPSKNMKMFQYLFSFLPSKKTTDNDHIQAADTLLTREEIIFLVGFLKIFLDFLGKILGIFF